MRFLADESCDFAVVRALRAAGHDVTTVADIAQQATDAAVLQLALNEGNILLTEDKDFGQLFYATGQESCGVILLRFPGNVRTNMAKATLDLVMQRKEELVGRFVVLQPGRVRIGPRYAS